jgi:putative oxidoreductase
MSTRSSEGQIDTARLIIPGLAGLYQTVSPYSYALIRFVAGAILVFHGYNKLFVAGVQGVADHVVAVLGLPVPLAWAYFIGILECFGGAALAVGFLTRPIAFLLTIEFAIITLWHSGNGYVFTSARRLRISAGAAGHLRRDLLPRRGALFDRPHDRQGILARFTAMTT